jgi:hypothetical protein
MTLLLCITLRSQDVDDSMVQNNIESDISQVQDLKYKKHSRVLIYEPK